MSVLIAAPAEFHSIMKIPLCLCMSHVKPLVMIYFFHICSFVLFPTKLLPAPGLINKCPSVPDALLPSCIYQPIHIRLGRSPHIFYSFKFFFHNNNNALHYIIYSCFLLHAADFSCWRPWIQTWSYDHMFYESTKASCLMSSWQTKIMCLSLCTVYACIWVWLICKHLSLGLCFHIRARRLGSLVCSWI